MPDDSDGDSGARPASEILRITVADADAGQRLDSWLAGQLPERSRAEVQRWIAAGRVTLVGRPLRASHRVSAGEAIEAAAPPPASLALKPEPIPLNVLYEDEDLLVIDKPAGMVVHPAPGNRRGTLVNAVLHRCPDMAGVGGARRPGVVHRLDKDTSGVILIAKADAAHRMLQHQFKAREVAKTYLALVVGVIAPAEGQIEAAIARDRRDRKRMAVAPPGEGRPAQTCYDTLRWYRTRTPGERFSLLSCRPLTGRTHQVRVHLAHAGHPIVGDARYGRQRLSFACPRQFLHAHRLRFRLPSSGREVEFTAPLPADLQAILDRLVPET